MRQEITLRLSRNFNNPTSRYASHGGFAIVPWGNSGSKLLIDWLGRLSVTGHTAPDTYPLGNLRHINAAPASLRKVDLYRATRRAGCLGYEARTPRHTGPRSISGGLSWRPFHSDKP